MKHLKQMASLSKMNQSWFKDECGFPGSKHREKNKRNQKQRNNRYFGDYFDLAMFRLVWKTLMFLVSFFLCVCVVSNSLSCVPLKSLCMENEKPRLLKIMQYIYKKPLHIYKQLVGLTQAPSLSGFSYRLRMGGTEKGWDEENLFTEI